MGVGHRGAYTKIDSSPMVLVADLIAKLLQALPPSLVQRGWRGFLLLPSCARQDHIQSLYRLVSEDKVKLEPLEMRKEPLLAAPSPLCPLQSQAIAAQERKLPQTDFEKQSISGKDGLVRASNKPNIDLRVPPDDKGAVIQVDLSGRVGRVAAWNSPSLLQVPPSRFQLFGETTGHPSEAERDWVYFCKRVRDTVTSQLCAGTHSTPSHLL